MKRNTLQQFKIFHHIAQFVKHMYTVHTTHYKLSMQTNREKRKSAAVAKAFQRSNKIE